MKDKEMKDKEMNIEEEKCIKNIIKMCIMTNSIPPKYWVDKIEKKYRVRIDLFMALCADIKSVL